MKIYIIDSFGNTQEVDLEKHITYYRRTIWIGGNEKDIYNTITIQGFDTFQCSITLDSALGKWLIRDWQIRTECPKGLLSDRAKACSMCMGRCVNLSPANPNYSLRLPEFPTLVNNNPIPPNGIILNDKDVISKSSICHYS